MICWRKLCPPPIKNCIITACLLVLSATAMSCGDDKKNTEEEKCVPECVSESVALICVENEQLVKNCGANKCYDGVCAAATAETCTDQPAECVGRFGYRACANGVWSEKISCGDEQACLNGKCLAESAVCETGDKKCTDDHKGYVICAGNGANGTWSTEKFDCAKGMVCSDVYEGECVPELEKCTATQPECTPDAKGYRVCVSEVWSDVIECTGTAVCKNGQCVGEDVTSKLPCGKVGEQKCVTKSRVQVCGTDNYWLFTDCPKDIPICDESINECAPSQCTDGDVKCDDNLTLATCVDSRWTLNKCPQDKPVCKDKKCQVAPKECTPGETKCLSEKQAYKCDSNGYWDSSLCTGDDFCHNGECVGCIDGETRCANDYRNLMTCKNGKYIKEDCPTNQYCPIDENKCVYYYEANHVGLRECSSGFSLCGDERHYGSDWLYFCSEGKIEDLICDDGCEYALDGIGSTCAGDSDESVSPCPTEGAVSTSIEFQQAYHKHKVECAVCKYSTSGKLRWMSVDKSYCN